MIGKTISHYKILEKLGEGGMGVVYKAEDMKLSRMVALKFLPKGIEADEAEQARFIQEAKAASALNHPNVCIIYDLQEHESQQFIVMEFVDGMTMREKIRAGAESVRAVREPLLPLKDVLSYAIQIGEALEEAHGKGIIHRDIKSDNVMVTAKGQVKVMDFGLAKLKGALRLTKSTSTLGTLAYMAPEQLQGRETDARMDIFSFGVVLYEMLTGHLPFRGEYESALMYSILNTEPEPVTKYRPELPSGFLFLLDKALEKEPDERYQSISEVLVDLRRLKRDTSKVSRKTALEMASMEQAEQPVPSPSVEAPKKKRTFLYVGAAALIVMLILVAYLLWPEITQVPKFGKTTQVTTAIGMEDYPTWSPEGGRLAYQSNQSGNWDIWVKQIGGGPPINLTADHEGYDRYPSWSPDGRQIAFWSDWKGDGYYVMPSMGGASPRKVTATSGLSYFHASPPCWSRDGTRLACVVRDSNEVFLEIISLVKSEKQRSALSKTREIALHELNWSPDERFIAYVSSADRLSQTAQIRIMDMRNGRESRITDDRCWNWSPSWSANGQVLFFVSDRDGSMGMWQQRITNDGTPMNSPQRLVPGPVIRYGKFSPDGIKLAYSKGRTIGNVWRVPIPKTKNHLLKWENAEQLTFEQVPIWNCDVSQDGRYIVFDSERDGLRHLWMMPVEGGEMKSVTINPTRQEVWPRWSPDGKKIIYSGISIVGIEDGVPMNINQSESFEHGPVLSPDGKEVAFSLSDKSGNFDIWIRPLEGDEARRLTKHQAIDGPPSYSPSGKWVSFISNRGGKFQLWLVPATGGNPKLVTEEAVDMQIWSFDENRIFFTRGGQIWEVSVEEGVERQLTNFTGKIGIVYHLSLATDGKYIYFVCHEEMGDIYVMDVEWE